MALTAASRPHAPGPRARVLPHERQREGERPLAGTWRIVPDGSTCWPMWSLARAEAAPPVKSRPEVLEAVGVRGIGAACPADAVVPSDMPVIGDDACDPPLVRRLKRIVLTGPRFDAAESDIARELGLSGRTLRRRLHELGTTYADTLAQVRFAFARHCLADRSLTICDVADRLGYTEVSNFRNAFKRWASCSPRAFRAGLGLGDDGGGLAS